MKNTNNIIIGFFFVILGLLLLLKNFNLLDFSIVDIFRLWPIALIYIGVEMLPVDPKTKIYLQIAVIVLFFVALISLPMLKNINHDMIDYDNVMIILKNIASPFAMA
jgi:hypothetical protein